MFMRSFNNFFTSMVIKLRKKIPPTMKTFTDYLERPKSKIDHRP